MATKTKRTSSSKTTNPHFEPGRVIGGFGNFEIVADVEGKLWQLDFEKGHARPVTYGKK